MSVQVEKLEHNMAKLTIEVEASKFDAAMKNAYNKKKGSFNLPGFRKGKVPMYIIEKEYGAGTRDFCDLQIISKIGRAHV